MQSRFKPKKSTNIRSFIGISISLHLVIVGILATSYLFSHNTVSANQYNLENSVKIDLTQISLPSVTASSSNDENQDQSEDIAEAKVEPEQPETPSVVDESPVEKPIEKEVAIAPTITPPTTTTVKTKSENKTKDKTVVEKKTITKKSSPDNQQQNESTNQDSNNNITSSSSGQTGQNTVLIKAVNPQYPKKALDMRIEGYVIVAYDITANGKTDNIRIVEAKPNNIFNRAVILAVKQWQYQPVKSENMMLKFVFNHKQNKIQYEIAKL